MISKENGRLLTWFDVERRLAEKTAGMTALPGGVSRVAVYSDGVEIYVDSQGAAERVSGYLAEWFLPSELLVSDEGTLSIDLLIGRSKLPVLVTIDSSFGVKNRGFEPLWKRIAYLDEGASLIAPQKVNDSDVKVAAFHSFKGGVGRTTSLLTFVGSHVARLMKERSQGRILIIDADVEAPGITFWLNQYQQAEVSYTQFLEALHSPPSSEDDVFDFFAKEIKKASIEVDGVQIFVLPAFINQTDLLNAKISPENIVRSPGSPWAVGDAIYRLGERLGVEYVFLDLRAGLSELSSPLLFDPRFHRFIVTTVTEQSVRGVELALDALRAVSRGLGSGLQARHPSIVITMLTETIKRSQEYLDVRERIESAYGFVNSETGDSEKDVISSNIAFYESQFSPDLMVFRSFEQAFSSLRRTSLCQESEEWFEGNEKKPNRDDEIENDISLDVQAKNLSDFCKAKVFAEIEPPEDLLATEALRNLGKSFSDEVANAVLIGAKGSGKTFSYMQVASSKEWKSFVAKLGLDADPTISPYVVPILRSNELSNHNGRIVDECFIFARGGLGIPATAPAAVAAGELRDLVDDLISEGVSQVGRWIKFWARVMGLAVGVDTDSLQDINDHVCRSGSSAVFLFDGVEDILRNILSSDVERAAVEAIIELPNRIRELRNPSIGVLAFIREDYAKAVKTQNFGQFESRYERFKLNWSPREFLQLVLWLCSKARIGWATTEDVEALDVGRLTNRLEMLWGKKLGRDDSAEAYSFRWVYAALSDLRGRLQARDAVRFLQFAASEAIDRRGAWNDRVLPPSAIRAALAPTSVAKIQDAVQEYLPLKQWMNELDGIDPSKKKIPFSAEDLKLDGVLRQSLAEIGVLYEDVDRSASQRFYIPEIYRYGLGFEYSTGARPRVQALLQRVVGNLPY